MFIKYCNKYVDMFEDIVNELLLRVPFPRTIKKSSRNFLERVKQTYRLIFNNLRRRFFQFVDDYLRANKLKESFSDFAFTLPAFLSMMTFYHGLLSRSLLMYLAFLTSQQSVQFYLFQLVNICLAITKIYLFINLIFQQ